MPKATQHQTKAEKNREFLNQIDVAAQPEWAVTVAFYTAVHWIEFLRAKANHGHSVDHEDRLTYIQHELPAVHTPFQQLYTVSRLARYESRSDFFNQFTVEDVQNRIISGWLVAIETFASTHIPKQVPPSSK